MYGGHDHAEVDAGGGVGLGGGGSAGAGVAVSQMSLAFGGAARGGGGGGGIGASRINLLEKVLKAEERLASALGEGLASPVDVIEGPGRVHLSSEAARILGIRGGKREAAANRFPPAHGPGQVEPWQPPGQVWQWQQRTN